MNTYLQLLIGIHEKKQTHKVGGSGREKLKMASPFHCYAVNWEKTTNWKNKFKQVSGIMKNEPMKYIY